jgi:predicted RNA-binding Zn-ribbon protein involved in translation (DUF1610 family)
MSSSTATARDATEVRHFPCEGCGADLAFNIGAQKLVCPHCGFQKALEVEPDKEVAEQDLKSTLAKIASRRASSAAPAQVAQREFTCKSCGGTIVFDASVTSKECAYCGEPVVDRDVHAVAEGRLPVDGLIPFQIERERARAELRQWVASRWFAPNEFKRRGVDGTFNGLYLPYWTFDAMTATAYRGERGDAYYVTVGSGKNKRSERRIRWSPASGHFQRFFDDVLVCASTSAKQKLVESLEPWPLERCSPFAASALAGYSAMTYDQELEQGFGRGKERIDEALRADVRQRIGGDEQRIHHLQTQYEALTYKHLLLPVWMLAYKWHEKSYQVVVNACTGEVQGERPYSAWKIFFAVLLALIVAGIFMSVADS